MSSMQLLFLVDVLLLWTVAECSPPPSYYQKCAVPPMFEWMCPADEYEKWSYGGLTNGPSEWGEAFPECNGQDQSPVAIRSRMARRDQSLSKLTMKNYDRLVKNATIRNDGHTVVIMPTDRVKRTIEVNGTTFSLRQFHFHWGHCSHVGSEHTLDGVHYAMEGHFVHFDSQGNLAVVAVFFKGGSRQEENAAMQPIVDVLPEIPYTGDTVRLKSRLNLNRILPSNPSPFFRYQGSLTTPPCWEGVIWSVLNASVPIGNSQMLKFRSLFSTTEEGTSPGCRVTNNHRPLQPLNDREIYTSS